MQKKGAITLYSPSDLITFMSDPFSSWMDRCYLEDREGLVPDTADESAALVQKLGIAHEQQFLESLINSGADVCIIEGRDDKAFDETVAALKAGREVIYQGFLRKDNFAGLSDFLVRVNGKSDLGDFEYEVWDSKLAKKPKPYFFVQLCCYAEMLETIQGKLPTNLAVVLGNKETKSFRTVDFYYFYKALKQRFLESQARFNPAVAPEWVNVGSHSRWTSIAEKILEDRDDLVQVANIRQSQIKNLKEVEIETMTALAYSKRKSIAGISQQTYLSLQAQAKIQIESKELERPLFELIEQNDEDSRRWLEASEHGRAPSTSAASNGCRAEPAPRSQRGLSVLPPAAVNDVFFDMEGYPHIEGGLEYLFGASTLYEGHLEFHDWWAHNREQEKTAFEHFVDWIYKRWIADEQMHVYHYGAYEISALRRLASRHATRETELDQLLRAEAFVDLYAVVRQSIRLGCDSYSIKKVELLYMDKRQGEVSNATESIVYYERWMEQNDGADWQSSDLLKLIRDYNQVDCDSTALLYSWLCDRQSEYGIKYSRPRTKSGAEVQRPITPSELLASELLSSIPKDRSTRAEHWRVTELLAHLLGFHRREAKVFWWELFDRASLSEDELQTDPDCIAFVLRTSSPPLEIKRSLLFEYSFDPAQDLRLKVGDKVIFGSDISTEADIMHLDEETGLVRLKRGFERDPLPQEGHLILKETMNIAPLEDSIYRQVSRFSTSGELKPNIRALLFREFPNLEGVNRGEALCVDQVDDAVEALRKMQETYICVQGPPGTGKTYLAAQAIVSLIKSGKRVGVSSNSHKAIENLLEEIGKTAEQENLQFRGAKVGHDKSGALPTFSNPQIELLNDKKVTSKLDEFQLLGATAWFFAKPELAERLDYLFIDEAGQVCLANVVAMAQSASNLVLIGDQLQLEQPVKGTHAGESGLSSLEYLLGDVSTVSPNRGIFLATTRRMHPNLCALVSSAVYDGRLHSDSLTEQRQLVFPPQGLSTIFRSNGILYLPVEHKGNSQSSDEEMHCIEELINELCKCQFKPGKDLPIRNLDLNDIMIVAPYNRQVRLIKSRIPHAEAGSVDRFQGREAPVVIISMCASDLANTPRGLDFLLSKKRLNVAISRAKLLAIIVGSPTLAEYACNSVEQSTLLNLYCRIMQEGSVNFEESEACIIGAALR